VVSRRRVATGRRAVESVPTYLGEGVVGEQAQALPQVAPCAEGVGGRGAGGGVQQGDGLGGVRAEGVNPHCDALPRCGVVWSGAKQGRTKGLNGLIANGEVGEEHEGVGGGGTRSPRGRGGR